MNHDLISTKDPENLTSVACYIYFKQ